MYHRSFLLETEKIYKCDIRGSSTNSKIEDIKAYLDLEKLEVSSIHQLFRGSTRNKVSLPLFPPHLLRLADQANLFQTTEILEIKVQFKKYGGRKGSQQSQKC